MAGGSLADVNYWLLVRSNVSHAARCVACHGVRSHAVPFLGVGVIFPGSLRFANMVAPTPSNPCPLASFWVSFRDRRAATRRRRASAAGTVETVRSWRPQPHLDDCRAKSRGTRARQRRPTLQPVVVLLSASKLGELAGIIQGAERESDEPAERIVVGRREVGTIDPSHDFEHGKRFEREEMVMQGQSAPRELERQRALSGHLT